MNRRLRISRFLCVAVLLGCALEAARAQPYTSEVVAWGDNTAGQTNVPANLTSAIAIAAGAAHGLAVRADGSVVAWGYSAQGQTNVPDSLTNAIAVAGGDYLSLALSADGRVLAWGRNTEGQTNVPASLSNAIAVAAGSTHSLALRADGSVVAWGYNQYLATNVPANLTNAIAIAAGNQHSLALRVNGSVVAWGGYWNGSTFAGMAVPASLTNAIAVATGNRHNLALLADGRVVPWGYGAATNVPANLTNAIAIAAGYSHSLALTAEGKVVAWGDNYDGQANVPADLANAIAVAGGNQHSLALLSSSTAQVSVRSTPATALQGPVLAGVPVALVGFAYGTLPFAYQWECNGAALADETSASLRFAAVQLSQNGAAYRLRVTNPYGAATSTPVALAVQGIVARVTSIPASALQAPVLAGAPVDLLGSVSGLAPFAHQWECNGIALAGETNNRLHFAAVQLSQDGAVYRLRATNLYDATTSPPVAFSVQALVVSANGSALASSNFFYGTTVVGSAVVGLASSFSNATIFYTLDGSPPDFTSKWYGGPFTITNSVVLRATAYNADWSAWDEAGPFYLYRKSTLSATNTGGGTVGKEPPDGPYFNYTNVTVTAAPNPGWTFLRWEGDASGTNPVVSVAMNTNKAVRAVFGTWLGTTVAGNGTVTLDPPGGWFPYGTAVRLAGVPQPGSYFGFWGNAASGSANPLLFTVTNPSPVVSCIFGTLATNQAALTVLITGIGQVTRSPQSNAYSLNQSVILTATPGSGQKFQGWSGDATGSQSPLTVVMDRSRVVSALFQTNSPTAPQIVQQPTNRVVVAGSPASFRVLASGTAPLAYQWRRNGAGVVGATSFTYTVAAAQPSDAGTYDAVVTNAFGSVTSSVATLSITLPGRISTIRLQPGGGLLLQATGTAGESLLFSTSTNLFDWLPWVLVSNPSGTVQVIDLAPHAPRKFYRAKQP